MNYKENNDYLSKKWVYVELGKIAIYEKGKKPPNTSENKCDSYPIPYVDIKAFEKGEIEKYTDGLECRFCDDEDFIIVWDGSRSGLVGKAIRGALGSTLMKIKLPILNNHFCYYFLKSKYKEINTRTKGTGTPHVDPDLLWNYSFPIPPLLEQHRIVAKIEELFSELDKGVEQLKAVREQLKVYRRSVLKWAFEGKLTEEWRKKNKHESAEKLLEKIKAEREKQYREKLNEWNRKVKEWEKNGKHGRKPGKPKCLKYIRENIENELFELPEIPSSWQWSKSGNLFLFITSGSRGWAKYYSESGAVFIRTTNLNYDTLKIDLNENILQYVQPPNNYESNRTRVKKGDFLFSITGYIGMFGICPEINEAYVNQHISLVRPIKGFVEKYFGYYIISKSGGNYQLNKLQRGATKSGLGLNDICNILMPMCSYDEQLQIVQEIETRLSICDKLEETIEASLEKADALRQSILKKAFEGKLVPQNPDDEPAETLLERIKAEKAKRVATKKSVGRRRKRT